MGRPKSTGENKTHQQHVLMTPSEVKAIDDWRFDNRVGSRGEAIRRLCQIGINSQNSIDTLKLSYQQMQRLILAMRDAGNDPKLTALKGEVADALILLVGQIIKTAIPALTMQGEGDFQLRWEAKLKLLARLEALDLTTDEGSTHALEIGGWFVNEISGQSGSDNPQPRPVDLE